MEKKVDLYGNVDFFFFTQLHCMVENVKKTNKQKTLVKLFFPHHCHFVCIFVSETHLVMISDGRLHVHYFNHSFLFIFLLFFHFILVYFLFLRLSFLLLDIVFCLPCICFCFLICLSES